MPSVEKPGRAVEALGSCPFTEKMAISWSSVAMRSASILTKMHSTEARQPPRSCCEAGSATRSNGLCQCEDGQTIYRNPDMKVGWRWREEAEEVASGLQSRTGEIHFVREHNPS